MNVKEVERLIKISREHPLMPDEYIPWQESRKDDEIYLPELLTSLHGLPVYDALTPTQKLDLGRHELVQVIASYAWGECQLCLFIHRRMLKLQIDDLEHQFLIREVIEELRHQEMFAKAIAQVGGRPIRADRAHRIIGNFTTKYLPADYLFMGALAVEMVTDVYGNYARKNQQVYSVMRKMFDLHNIEEARHILFTKALLKDYSDNAGYVKRTLYSYVILLNILFTRTLYVRREIYERIGIANANEVYKIASKNFKYKFAEKCLGDIIEFVESWGGFNRATRWVWRWLLGAKV